ncbi:MAG: bifunctional DNA primase/polymerase [Pseudonocardiales bacterium]|nr:bifunctional DNA primase/polymerase [Pseudonocardiales bacterium]
MTHTAPGHIPHRHPAPQAQPDSPGTRALAAAAVRAAAAGWAVFPVRPRGKTPAVRGWEDTATLDPDRILAWWASAAWNIGIAAGRSGLLVVDLDVPAPGPHPAAAAARGTDVLRRLAADADAAPAWDTFTVATPSGGRHLYFRQPDGAGLRNTQGALGPLIDTRGHGGYVLAAGSRGPGTRRYRILRDVPVAPLPAWLHDALTTTPVPPPPTGDPVLAGDQPGPQAGVDSAAPNVSAARVEAYLRAVVDGESRAVTDAPVGTRHSTLLRAARRLGQWVGSGALTGADVRTVLTAAARGYVGVDGYTAQQVERDITDGLAYGAARPRHIDDLPDRPAAHRSDTGR